MSMRNIFKIVLDSNAEAGKLVTARIAGKAAKEALFANPTVLQGVLTSSAVLTAASLADPDTAHGKALHYLGLGMTMDSADELLRVCDEAGVFQMKGTAEDSATADMQAVVSKTFDSKPFLQMLGVLPKGDGTKETKPRFSTQAKPAGVTANAIENPNKIEAKEETTAEPVSVKVGPEVATPVLLPTKDGKDAKTEKPVLRCAFGGCGSVLRKVAEQKPFHLPTDKDTQKYITDDERKLEGSYLCKFHRDVVTKAIQKRKNDDRMNKVREQRLAEATDELTNVEAELREGEKALAASEKTINKITDPIIKSGAEKAVEEKRNSIQNLRKRSIALQNKCKQISEEIAKASK